MDICSCVKLLYRRICYCHLNGQHNGLKNVFTLSLCRCIYASVCVCVCVYGHMCACVPCVFMCVCVYVRVKERYSLHIYNAVDYKTDPAVIVSYTDIDKYDGTLL